MGINTAFGGIHEAKFSEGGVWILPGVYRFRVLACKHITSRAGKDGFVVELEVLESNVAERPTGSTCSWIVMLDKEPALGNVKQFASTALGVEDHKITEAVMIAV